MEIHNLIESRVQEVAVLAEEKYNDLYVELQGIINEVKKNAPSIEEEALKIENLIYQIGYKLVSYSYNSGYHDQSTYLDKIAEGVKKNI